MSDLGPAAAHGRFTVVLAAWSLPPEASRDPRLAFERRDAIRAFTRAVLAAGGSIAMTADGHVAPLVAQIALDYAPGALAERRGERPAAPLVVMETERRDDTVRGRLAPFAWRHAITYVDGDGRDVSAELPRAPADEESPGDEPPAKERPRRQRLTGRFIERMRPVAAVVISAPADALEELAVLRMAGLDTVALGRTMLPGRAREMLREHDVEAWMARLEAWRHRWVGRDDPERRGELAIPYAYLAQRLAARWERPA